MIISKKVWDRYQNLRSSKCDDKMYPDLETERQSKVLRLHLALFYDIGEKPSDLLEGKLIDVPRPYPKRLGKYD